MSYSNGNIYKIWNKITNDIYVGSTCQSLAQRMEKHREAARGKVKAHRQLYVKMNEFGHEHFHIELIEEYPCDNKEQLRKTEGEYTIQLGTLNLCVAGRTRTETLQAYRQTPDEDIKKYYQDNKENILSNHKHIMENIRKS